MRKMFLDDLPRYYKGIDWKSCIGKNVKFIYDDIEGEVKILDYIVGSMPHLVLEYKGSVCDPIAISGFQKCQIATKILKLKSKQFLFNIGQVLETKLGEIKITNAKKENGLKLYQYKCLKCGYNCDEHYIKGELIKEKWIVESSLKNGCGCAVCGNICTVTEINSIYKTYPYYKELGIDEEWAKKYSLSTRTEAPITCPYCGNKYHKRADHVIRNRNSYCGKCGDGFKFPEKFINNVLNQLGVEFLTQLSSKNFKWCGKYRYDFYIPKNNMIIEVHGGQHYKSTTNFKMSLKEIQENDKIKEELAKENGIENYIVIDFRKSEFEWAIWNIHKKLKCYFDFSNVNFENALNFALGNYKKQICEMWDSFNDGNKTIGDFVKEFNIKETKTCIRKYLKFGDEVGWCVYDAEVESLKANKKSSKKSKERDSKSINVTKDGYHITTYKSFADLEKYSLQDLGVKINKSSALQRCKGRIDKPLHGYMFEYIS